MAERLLARRTCAFTPSPIQQLSLLAQRCHALNLAEGFPDFPAPPEIKEAAIAAIKGDFNQYSPHNPTGKVFSSTELAAIAALCCKYDCLAISDEVYEHITFDNHKHMSIASFPDMQQRSIVTSSLSKTFSVTGWRIGWAIAPPAISAAIGNIHVKLTDSAPGPFQEAALVALQSSPSFYTQLKQEYEMRRDFVCKILHQAGFTFLRPQGSFFVFAELPKAYPWNDVEYVAELIKGAGVAIVPGCGFFHEESMRKALHQLGYHTPHNEQGVAVNSCEANNDQDEIYKARYVRVAFCKDMATLRAADIAFRKHCASRYPGQ